MIAIVIGLGSMGKRRIRLLRQVDEHVRVIGVDQNIDRRKEALQNGCDAVYGSIEAAFVEHPSVAFVSTSPLSHHGIINELLH